MKPYAALPLALALAACATPPQPTAPAAPAVGMANPASVHCVQLGGRLDIERTPTGDVGYCTLPSGERVEEWELFRRSR